MVSFKLAITSKIVVFSNIYGHPLDIELDHHVQHLNIDGGIDSMWEEVGWSDTTLIVHYLHSVFFPEIEACRSSSSVLPVGLKSKFSGTIAE